MSGYEDYARTSTSYDATRVPVGLEIILGCFARGDVPLRDMHVLDAGCGTGSYSAALVATVGSVTAIDLNAGMLAVARGKLGEALVRGRVRLARGALERLPCPDGAFDGAIVNQVLHHLDDTPELGYPLHRRALGELARVLRPGGVLLVNTCSHAQLRHGWWYYRLIREAVERVRRRHLPIEALETMLGESGCERGGRFVPLAARLQGDAYFELEGPSRKAWREGDSIWALVTPPELERALARLRELEAKGLLRDFFARADARRAMVGQVTFVCARRQIAAAV